MSVPGVVIVCAWCDTSHAETKRLEAEGFTVSHGICAEHSRQWQAEAEKRGALPVNWDAPLHDAWTYGRKH